MILAGFADRTDPIGQLLGLGRLVIVSAIMFRFS